VCGTYTALAVVLYHIQLLLIRKSGKTETD
jgi:hypothetical protein